MERWNRQEATGKGRLVDETSALSATRGLSRNGDLGNDRLRPDYFRDADFWGVSEICFVPLQTCGPA